MTSPVARLRSRRRTGVVALLAAACVLLLSACGARVDTLFTLEDGPTGSRVMTLTLSRSDLDQYVVGGAEALEASIQAHKPAELDYSGLTVTEENATAAFTLAFDSADTYREKVAAVLAASGYEGVPTIALSTEDSLFLQGAAVQEDFTSLDLLAWLPDGLVADGTVSADNEGNILESGNSDVVYGGETTSAYQPISFDEMTDHGVSAVDLTTWLHPDGTFERAVAIRMPVDAYESDREAFDAHFADATPDGGTLTVSEADGWSVGWVLTFTADDATTLATMTDQALSTDGTQFTVSEEPDADNPTRRRTTVVDVTSCDAICSPDATALTSTLVAPTGWELAGTSADATTEVAEDGLHVTRRPTSTPVEFDHAIPFDSIHVTTTFGFDRSVEQTLTFAVTDEDDAAAGDGFARLLTVDGLDEPTVTSTDGITSYVLTVTAENAEDYTTQIAALTPTAYLSVAPVDGDGFWWSRHRTELHLGLAEGIASGGVRQPVVYETRVPFGHSISEDLSALGTSGSIDGRTATAVADGPLEPTSSIAFSGPTVAVIVLGAILLLGAIALAVALVLFHDRVTTAIDTWMERRAGRKAEAAARGPEQETIAPQAAVPGGSVPPHANAPSPSALTSSEQFSEADLV